MLTKKLPLRLRKKFPGTYRENEFPNRDARPAALVRASVGAAFHQA
jgi:hypothetical protein